MIRKADIDGEACSTCRFVEWGIDRHDMPWHQCQVHGEPIGNPDEYVCDRFEDIP